MNFRSAHRSNVDNIIYNCYNLEDDKLKSRGVLDE